MSAVDEYKRFPVKLPGWRPMADAAIKELESENERLKNGTFGLKWAMADTAAFVESAPWEVLRQANAQLRCCGNCSNAAACNCRQSDGRGMGCGGEAWAP